MSSPVQGMFLEPEHDVTAIGSGGNFALAAARGMMDSDKDAETIAAGCNGDCRGYLCSIPMAI